MQRKDLTPDQKAALEKALQSLGRAGSNYRQVMEVSRGVAEVLRAIGGAGGFGGPGAFGGGQFPGGGPGGGLGGGALAEPGTYVVRLTVAGKTMVGKIGVRADPILAAAENR